MEGNSPERSPHFATMVEGLPITACCSVCERVFIAHPRAKARTDDLILQIREEFDGHNCYKKF